MRKLLLATLIASMAFAQTIKNERGYFSSVGIGANFLKIEQFGAGSTQEFEGVGLDLDLRVGALVKRQWAVTFDVVNSVKLEPDATVNGTVIPQNGLVFYQGVGGPGLTYYFDNKELFYAGGTLGLAYFFKMNSNWDRSDKSKLGYGVLARTGKDWRINPGMLIGVELNGGVTSAGVTIGNVAADYWAPNLRMLMNLKFGNRCVLSPEDTQKYRDCMKGF